MARPTKKPAEIDGSPEHRALAMAHAVSLMGDAVKQYGPVEAGDVVLTLAKRFEDYIDG
jgi:hypothetical protein